MTASDPQLPLLPPDLALVYTCPGETHSISHSVHLSRLASGFAACRRCPHNGDLPNGPDQAPTSEPGPRALPSLVTENGVRGVYLNELDRTRAAQWGAAFAAMLWDQQPRVGRAITPNSAVPARSVLGNSGEMAVATDAAAPLPELTVMAPSRRGPVVVIGFDERPSSPDIVMGVALGLRRMGCQVIDLGQTTRPCFHFAVHHLEAVGGIFVTGSGCDPAATGFHFAGRNSIPWLQTDLLRTLEQRATQPLVRPTRTAGAQRPFHAAIPYQTSLWKLFHALRPLQIVCGTSAGPLARELDALFTRLPCRLTHEALPVRRRNLNDPHDVDVQRLAAATVTGQQHLGVIIDDDGERCAFVTDSGELVTIPDLTRLLVLLELHEHRSTRLIADERLYPDLTGWQQVVGSAIQLEPTAAPQIPTALIDHNASLGVTADNRVWFGGTYPACNAIMTLARVLQALSLSDAPMSEVLRRSA